jgi:hypothetical protein
VKTIILKRGKKMNERFIKKIVLLIFISFFTMAMFGQSTPAKDKPSANRLLITGVKVNFEGKIIYIYGQHFSHRGNKPDVILFDDDLSINEYNDGFIEAILPSGIGPGDYLLVVSNQQKSDAYALTIGTATQYHVTSLLDRVRLLESGNIPRFTDMGDGTIRDNKSGLIWLKKANCFEWTYWSKAMDTAAALESGKCELTDGSAVTEWRLPTKAEWEAFMSAVYEKPALVNTVGDAQWSEGDAFTGVQSYFYWTSDVSGTESAWFADTRFGLTDLSYTGDASYIWPVRSGK